jgi:TolB protein
MNADGGNPVNLTNRPTTFDENPSWSPDGSKIAYSAGGDIYVMNADGSGRVDITDDPSFSDNNPAWSPDGSMIVFTSDRGGNIDVFVMNADGTGQTNLTDNPAFDGVPDWGPVTPTPFNAIWGDSDCSGSPDPVDSLFVLRFDAGLSTNTGDCPAMGQVIYLQDVSLHRWGDVDCGSDVTPVDSLKLLRHDAGLGVAQAQDCPVIGSEVLVIQ